MASLLPCFQKSVSVAGYQRVFCYRPGPNQLGPEYNLHVLQAFAEHVAPALGWKPNTEGPVAGDAI